MRSEAARAAGGYTSSGATACIVVNNTSFAGNLSNTGTHLRGQQPERHRRGRGNLTASPAARRRPSGQ